MLKKNEELFSESTMSFGDHLEELRVCLWRAVIWLVCGFGIGLIPQISGNAVKYIQTPLNKSLEKYYLDQGVKLITTEAPFLIKEGYDVKPIIKTMRERSLYPEIVYIYEGELENLINAGKLLVAEKNTTPETKNRPESVIEQVDNLAKYKDDDGVFKQKEPKKNEKTETDKKVAADANELEHPKKTNRITGIGEPHPFVMFKELKQLKQTRASALGVHETFSIYIKAALMIGFVIGSPGIFYSVWSFVAAGLYMHERKYVYIFLPFSIILFIAGACLAFFVVVGYVLDFLFSFNAWMNVDPDTRISEWMSFAFLLPIGFGISFQLPLVIFVLERVGILTIDMLVSKWRIAVLVIFVISMFLTPSDPQSMILMAVPLTFLYFCGIGLCYLIPKKKSEFDEDDQ
ncbi:MAG: twin-arginine translocase subunit TatC [Thermoguttaceae bacterium]